MELENDEALRQNPRAGVRILGKRYPHIQKRGLTAQGTGCRIFWVSQAPPQA